MPHNLPFRLSLSAEDADPDTKLIVAAGVRRVVGAVSLEEHDLVFVITEESPGAEGQVGREIRVRYSTIGSAVLRAGVLTSRLRITACDKASFADVAPRSPREVTLLVNRKHRHEARHFVSQLQIRVAEARLHAGDDPVPG